MDANIEGQRPGESTADFTARLMALIQEERRQKEEERRQKEEERRQKEESMQRLANLPFLVFVDSMEDLVFSSLSIERGTGKTSGKNPTDVSGKMYPRSIRPWDGFAEQHAGAFGDLRDALGDEPHFKSTFAIEAIRNDLCRRTSIASEFDARHFVDLAIETPVAEIMTAYLNVIRPGVNHAVHFQNNAYLKLTLDGPRAKRTSPTKDLQPDRWCFVYEFVDVDGEQQEVDDKTVNILVGEIKPPFKLRASTLANVLSSMNHDTFFRDAVTNVVAINSEDEDGEPAKRRVPGHVLVAQVLCQAYHYMIGSGCKYGYISSGESLVCLYIDSDFGLCYHFASFVVPDVRNVEDRRQQNRGQRQPHETAVAYLASLCLWASRTTRPSSAWISASIAAALRWPKSKEKAQSLDAVHINRPGGPGPSDDEGPGDGGGSNTRTTAQYIPLPSRPQKRNRSPEKDRQPNQGRHSQSQRDEDEVAALALALKANTKPFKLLPAEPPTLPYCTQACLRGLVRGQPLDNKCPNVALHRDARLRTESRRLPLSLGIYLDDQDLHPLTASALRTRLVAQLAANMDMNCKCMAPHTNKARYGKFFKLAVTGFGYTFAGKGVRAASYKVLEHEAVVYNAVPHLQGFLIPVFLGIINLEYPIPMPDLSRVEHIMLMSYAGPDLTVPHALPSHIDVMSEMDRSTRDLERAGIDNPDVREANVAWNAEVQRVMHFDFDRVDLSELPTAPTAEEGQVYHKIEGKRVKTEATRASGIRSPLLSRTGLNAMDGAVGMPTDDLVKKQLC